MSMLKKALQKVSKASLDLSARYNDLVRTTTLPNGLQLASQIRLIDPTFEFAACIKAGALQDPAGNEGTAHFLEHVLATRDVHETFRRRKGFLELATSSTRILINGEIENSEEIASLRSILSTIFYRRRFG